MGIPRGDAALGKSIGYGAHKGMRYARPRTMRQHITDARSKRHLQQARHSSRLVDSKSHCL